MAEIILTIVVEAVKCCAPSACRQISYLRESKYTSNLQNLKAEVETLKTDTVSTEHEVDDAKRKGEEIEEKVEYWLARAKDVIEEADKFISDEATANNRCFRGSCPNLKTRRRLSKEAVRLMEAVVKVREAGRFGRVSYRTAPEDIRLVSNKDYEPFESRMPTLRNILSALEDPDVNMLGIYGMGGIGKTMLAEEVARKVKSDKLFDQVVFVEVSQNQDIRKIQGEIADKLGLKFHEESESGRANSLFKRIKEEKILIILDNIWENLDLRVVGIPQGDCHKGCKILLTARSEDVLSRKMDSRTDFSIGVLNEEEAWSLFKKIAGDYVEGSELKEVARDVAKECAGLPVSIVTVARGLRNKRLLEWKDALEQLRRPSLTNFISIQPTAYKAIKLSYDNLEGEELRNTFLLIGYTAISSIDELLLYGMGLDLFQGVNKMEAARARAHSLVQKLKASCMLLDDSIRSNEEYFSMHDVVRDVAISIASSAQNVFLATNKQVDICRECWSDENALKLYTSIVLRDIKANLLPEVVECPQLKLLYVSADWRDFSSLTILNKFFESMKKVRVINLAYMNLQSLPSSLGLLSNLRTLSLYYCRLLDISVIGDLKKLEILCLQGCMIKKLPAEVGELTWLKLLDLRYCNCLEVIPPNILSKLFRLEELFVGGKSFCKWGVEVDGVKNASLQELKHLPNLTSLELGIDDANTLPRGLFFEKLERYLICIGDQGGRYWERPNIGCRAFNLTLNNNLSGFTQNNTSRLKDGLIVQLQGIEVCYLCELLEQDVNYFVNELVKAGPSQLKHLYIRGFFFSTDAFLAYLNLTESEYQRPQRPLERLGNDFEEVSKSLANLQSQKIFLEDNVKVSSTLFIEKVDLTMLENLVLHSINVGRIWQNQVAASSFVRLQRIEIEKCRVLEELIVMDNQDERKNNIVMFPLLQYLKMYDLEKLKSLCTGDVDILEFPSLKELWISRCPEFMLRYKRTTNILTEKVFSKLEKLTVDSMHVVTKKYLFSEDLLCKLRCLCVEFDCAWGRISSLDHFLLRLHAMKVLKIDGECYARESKENVENGMEVIISKANKRCDLKRILKKESSIMNDLVILHVMSCDHLINLVPSWTSFQNLTSLKVSYCRGLKNVLTSSMAKTLVRLREMAIESCLMITEIVLAEDGAKEDVIAFSELKELKLLTMPNLTSFFSGSCTFKFPSLEGLLLDDCPNMKIFSGGELITPKLHKVQQRIWEEEHSIWEHDLNTTVRQLYLKKLGEILQSQQFHMSASAPILNLHTELVMLPAMIAGVWSDDDSLQLKATTLFRKLLSIDGSPPIKKVIQSGVVPRFVEFLMREDNPQLQFQAAWTLRKIASGTSENSKVLIDHGAVPIFVKLLASPRFGVRQQAVWALGNVAGDSTRCRDLVLSEGALIPLLAQLNEHANLSMLRTATETLSNLCRGKPQPPFNQVRLALPVLAQLVHSNDDVVLRYACQALAYLSDGTNDKIQVVIEAGVCPRLVKLLGDPWSSAVTPALRTVGNIVKGDDFQTQYALNCGALPYLLGLLIHNHEKSIRKDVCWTISNITAGNKEQIQAVIDAGLIGHLVKLLQVGIKEAAHAISNATSCGSHEQIKYLVREGCIKPLCDHLQCPDPWIVTACLEGLENILKVGESEKNMGTAIGGVNQYARLVEEAEGFVKLGIIIQNHGYTEIPEKALEILLTYRGGLCLEEDHDTEKV